MATNFPTSLDSLTNPATTDQLSSPSHAAQHANANDAIEKLEAKVGVDGSTVTTSHSYKIAQLELDLQNSIGDYIPLSVLGEPDGVAKLDLDGNLIVPENKIIIEGATADAHELTIQAPDVTSDITVTLPNASGTLALTTQLFSGSYTDLTNKPNIALGAPQWTANHTLLSNGVNTRYLIGDIVYDGGNIYVANFENESIPTSNTTYWTSLGSGKRLNIDGRDIPNITYDQLNGKPTIPSLTGYATESYVSTAISNLVDTAPAALDTLNELAAALGDDANFATTVTTSLSDKASLTSANTFTVGPQQINTGTSSNAGLIIKGAVGQNSGSALTQWQSSTSSVLAQITGTGRIYSSVSITAGAISTTLGTLTVVNPAASTIGAVIRAAASQTANLLEFQNSSGTAVTFFNSSGGLTATEGVISTAYSGGKMTTGTLGYFNATTFNAAVSPVVVRGAASQTADLTQWQNSSGTVLASVDAYGTLLSNWKANIISGASYLIPLVVKGAASQTANLQEWQNSSGGVLLNIDSTGNLDIGAGSNNIWKIKNQTSAVMEWQPVQGFMFLPYGASNRPVTIKGAASQTGNLTEWQNSSGAILARITSTGVIGTTQNIYASRYYYSGNGTDTATSISFIDGVNGGGLNIRNIDLGTPNAGFDNVVPLTISGNINQTANLQNWKNAAGTILAKVDSTGAMFTITPAANTNTTQVATTAYVQTELADLVNSAPATLDTLNELATALGNDANFSTTVTNSIALKAPLASPALTGTPTAPTATAGTNTTQIATTAFVKTEITSSVQPGAVYQTSAPSSPAVGQIWIDSDQDVTTFDSNIIRRKSITATAGQTVFTTDLPFIDGFEQVFFNGLLLLKTSDYTTSGGNTVTLTSAAAVSDIVEIVSVTGANSVSTYTQAETNALLAANTSVAPLSISANTTLVAKKRYFVTSASALTLTLPATPALNDEIQILDASGNASTYNITVARNGNKINGGTGNLIIDMNGAWTTLLYTGSTYGWKVG
jgi:hypothetical protein